MKRTLRLYLALTNKHKKNGISVNLRVNIVQNNVISLLIINSMQAHLRSILNNYVHI